MTKPPDWRAVEERLFDGAKTLLAQLAERRNKESEICFWTHVERGPVFLYTRELNGGDGAGQINVPPLNRILRGSFDLDALQMAFHRSIIALKDAGHFDPFVDGTLSVYFQTVDEERALVCVVGDVASQPQIFAERPFQPVVLELTDEEANSQWWLMTCAEQPHEQRAQFHRFWKSLMSDRGLKRLKPYGTSLKHLDLPTIEVTVDGVAQAPDWLDGDASFTPTFFSYRLCTLLKQLGIVDLEYLPVRVAHHSLEQTSESYYQLVAIPQTCDFVFAAPEAPALRFASTLYFKDENTLFGRTGVLKRSRHQLFASTTTHGKGLIVNDRVRQACEANAMGGIRFERIQSWEVDELTAYQKLDQAGDLYGTWRLGMLHLEGILVERSLTTAIDRFETVIAQGDAAEVGRMIEELRFYNQPYEGWFHYLCGLQQEKDGDLSRARHSYKLAVDQGFERAPAKLAALDANPSAKISWTSMSFWRELTAERFRELKEAGAEFSDIHLALKYGLNDVGVIKAWFEAFPACFSDKGADGDYVLTTCIRFSNSPDKAEARKYKEVVQYLLSVDLDFKVVGPHALHAAEQGGFKRWVTKLTKLVS